MKLQRIQSTIEARRVDTEALTVDFVVSTPSLDSYGTKIDQGGWELEQFKRNPVITWAHDDRGFTPSGGLPIANAVIGTIRVENGQLKMTMRFTPKDVNPFGYQVFQLIAQGFLHGSSVGFEPLEDEVVNEAGVSVRWYRKQRLLEVAIVTIPSNDDALAQRARELNRDPAEAKEAAAELERMAEESMVQMRADFEKYKGYFEKKQPANRASTKVLEQFFKLKSEKQPEDEVEAWERMGQLISQPTPKAPEAPAPARKDSVQLSAVQIRTMVSSIGDTLSAVAVKALQQGVPSRELGPFMDSVEQKLRENLLRYFSQSTNGADK